MANDQLSGVCPQLVNSTKVVKSAEAHNGSKGHCVPKVKTSCEHKKVESTTVSQRQISRSNSTETNQKALRHMPDQRLLAHVCLFCFSWGFWRFSFHHDSRHFIYKS